MYKYTTIKLGKPSNLNEFRIEIEKKFGEIEGDIIGIKYEHNVTHSYLFHIIIHIIHII